MKKISVLGATGSVGINTLKIIEPTKGYWLYADSKFTMSITEEELPYSYDYVIVGGGPSGSMAAYEIAKAGFSVCIFEKDSNISKEYLKIAEKINQL